MPGPYYATPMSQPPSPPSVNGHHYPLPPLADAAAHQTLGRIEAQQQRLIEINVAQLQEASRTRETLALLPERLARAIPPPAPSPPPSPAPATPSSPPSDHMTPLDKVKLALLAALGLITTWKVAIGKLTVVEAVMALCKPLGCG